MKCLRPTCNNDLKTGRKYCSSSCAARDRKREAASKLEFSIPPKLTTDIEKAIGAEQANIVLKEVDKFLKDEAVNIPLPLTGQTYGDLVLSYDGTKAYRPSSELSFDIIEKMLRSGPVVFAMEMKRGQVFKVFSEGRYKAISPDVELAEIADAALKLIFPKMMYDITRSAFGYGT